MGFAPTPHSGVALPHFAGMSVADGTKKAANCVFSGVDDGV
jgi:hypothetical protein